MPIIKKIKDFIDTKSFLSRNKRFNAYESNRKGLYSLLKKGWQMKDNYIYIHNKYWNCDIKIKDIDDTSWLTFCVGDIPLKNVYTLSDIYEILYEIGSHSFNLNLNSEICNLLNEYWKPHLGNMHQDDNESGKMVYNREKVSKELMDIFTDYSLEEFDAGFKPLSFDITKTYVDFDYKLIEGNRLTYSASVEMFKPPIIYGIRTSFTDEITEGDIDVMKHRLLDIDENLKFNYCLYKRHSGGKTIYSFQFYYEFAGIKEISNYLLKLGLLK